MTKLNSTEALERADRLISHMAGYVGKMAPGSYSAFYAELNDHFIFMKKMRALLGREEE